MQGYRISTAFEEMDLDCIHHFISQSYWAKGVPRDTLDKAVRNSFCFGVFTESINKSRLLALLLTKPPSLILPMFSYSRNTVGKALVNGWFLKSCPIQIFKVCAE